VTKNIDVMAISYYIWNESESKILIRNNWRASLVPAAAVIPSPIAYVNVAAVKKLVGVHVLFRITVYFCKNLFI